MRRGCALVLMGGALAALPVARSPAADLLGLGAGERERILAHGPWPAAPPRDTSNRASGRPAAIAYGEVLFHSARLSTVGGLRCASCHEPWRSLADGRALAVGAEPGMRNTPSLYNVGLQRSFGWDGANDSLWAQSIRPLLDPAEMRAGAAHVAALVRTDAALGAMHAQAFGAVAAADEALLVEVGKALAAYLETLSSALTPFDRFRDALARGDDGAASAYDPAALRGWRVFDARCAACHSGAMFSDGRFHVSLIDARQPGAPPDGGRAAGVASLRANPFNLLGAYNDDPSDLARAEPTRTTLREAPRHGAFRTPPLREVAATGPYMHDGSVETLCDAVQAHALEAGSGPPGAPGSPNERRDLVAFLRSLSAQADPPWVDAAVLRCP